jgi:hypothetical protein
MTGFHKRVSTIEKLFLVYNRLRGPFANQFLVEGVGRIDVARVREAVRVASAVNPGACLRMRGHLAKRAWVPGPAPKVTLIRDAHWDGTSEVGAPFLDAPLDEHGPTCEVQIVESGNRTFLIFRSLHAVMDGQGTVFWAHDVLRALRGEAPIGHPCALTDTEFAAGLTDDKLELPPADAIHPSGRADAVTSGNDFCWRKVTLPEPADVHVVATMAYVTAAEARRHGEGVVRFNIPADLRFFRKEERSTGNVIGALFVDVAPGATVQDIGDQLKQRLKARDHARFPENYERMRWLPIGALQGLVGRGLAREHATGRYAFTGTISYMGTIDRAAVQVPGLAVTTAFFVPPMADQSCFVAGCRYGDHMELMMAMPRVLSTNGRFDALLDRLIAALSRNGVAPRRALARSESTL